MKKKVLLALLVAAAAFSQSIDIQRQTRAPQPTPATAQVWVYVPGVGNWPATIGPGLSLTGAFPNFVITAPAGSSGPTFVDGVVPTGALDGTNAAFALPSAPSPATSLQVFRNGVLQKAGAQFTLSGAVITFNASWIPQAGDDLTASYRR